MFEAALAVAAEPVIEWSAHQLLVEREGNRSPYAAPQNLYPCAGTEQWLAVSCATDAQWRSLTNVIGHAELADDPELASLVGRRKNHDRLDAVIAQWAATMSLIDAVELLLAEGVPAAPARDGRRIFEHPQIDARGYAEPVEHTVVGTHPTPGLPFRYASVDRWIRRPAPVLGEHNVEILGGWLGRTPEELAELEQAGVIGTWPQGL